MPKTAVSRTRQITAWCLFDFANSSFTTVVVSAVYAVYFKEVVAKGQPGALLWNGANFLSNLLIILLSPVIGAIADFASGKKRYLGYSFVICISATASLFFFGEGFVWPALVLFVVANTAFALGENLIAGFLPDLADDSDMGKISARGWATGYLGALVSLFPCLWLATSFGDTGLRATNLIVAVFFLVGGLPTFLWITEKPRPSAENRLSALATRGFQQVLTTWRTRAHHPDLFRFLGAYTVFNIGIYGVISFAGIYAAELIGMNQAEIIGLFIVTQLTAGVGALVSGRATRILGCVGTVRATLFIWTAAGTLGVFAANRFTFWIVALLAGAAMGSTLPAARAVIGLLAPREQCAEFFGFWGLCARSAALLAALGNGLLLLATGQNLRSGIVFFTLTFVAGLWLLRGLREPSLTRHLAK